jgi:hypothetical protein
LNFISQIALKKLLDLRIGKSPVQLCHNLKPPFLWLRL